MEGYAITTEDVNNVLKVSVSDDPQIIKSRYRTAIHRYQRASPAKFIQAVRIYNVLVDPHLNGILKEKGRVIISKLSVWALAEEGDLEGLENEIRRDHSVLDKRKDGQYGTPLYFAARGNQLHIVKALIEWGADPEVAQRDGSTALHVASWYSHPEIVRSLLYCGANPNVLNKFKTPSTPIKEAKQFQDLRAKKVLEVYQEFEKEPSKLCWVKASCGDMKYFSELKDFPNYINSTNICGQTILHIAAKKGYKDFVQYLLNSGAEMNVTDQTNSTALHIASFTGHIDIVNILLLKGADTRFLNIWGKTAEEEARTPEITQLFKKEKQKDIFIQAQSEANMTWFRQYYERSWLIARDKYQRTLLHIAARCGNLELIKFLVEEGADIEALMNVGSTPLHTAAFRGHVKIVEYLLQRGARIYVKNLEGHTPQTEALRAEYHDTSQPVPEHIKMQICDLFKQRLNQYSNFQDSVFPIQLFNAKNQLTHSIHISSETTFGNLATIIDPNIAAPQPSPIRNYPLNMGFSISGRTIYGINYHSVVLQNCVKFIPSKSQFMELPISIKYEDKLEMELRREDLGRSHDCKKPTEVEVEIAFDAQPNMNVEQIITVKDIFQIVFPPRLIKQFSGKCFLLKATISGTIMFLLETINTESQRWPNPSIRLLDPDINAKLYLYDEFSRCWFGDTLTVDCKIPSGYGTYALVAKESIIPGKLSVHRDLLADNFLQPVNGEPDLTGTKTKWTGYRILLRNYTPKIPDNYVLAYHGTSINAVESIIREGLVKPGTLISTGKVIDIPPNHIGRNTSMGGLLDFSVAIFVSPSFGYASHFVYSTTFHWKQRYKPVIECLVEKNSYEIFRSTTPTYVPNESDPKDLEWRITDPRKVIINSVLIVRHRI
jgi:ankyrin repeat protein